MTDEPIDAPEHSHKLPGGVRLAIAGLIVVQFLLIVAVGLISVYVYQQQQFIQGRGEYRDAEAVRLEERIRRSTCDLLDQFPEGGLLERPRNKYGCGPGMPGPWPPDQQPQ